MPRRSLPSLLQLHRRQVSLRMEEAGSPKLHWPATCQATQIRKARVPVFLGSSFRQRHQRGRSDPPLGPAVGADAAAAAGPREAVPRRGLPPAGLHPRDWLRGQRRPRGALELAQIESTLPDHVVRAGTTKSDQGAFPSIAEMPALPAVGVHKKEVNCEHASIVAETQDKRGLLRK